MASETFRVGRSRVGGGDRLRAEATPAAGTGLADLSAFGLRTDGLRFTGGPTMNALARCAQAPTCSPPEDPIRRLANLYDSRLGSVFRFSETSDLSLIDADLNMLAGGNATNASDAAFWTVGIGSALVQSFEVLGVGTLRLLSDVTARGNVGFYQDVQCRALEILKASATLYASGGANEDAQVQIQNLANGHYLRSDGSWSPNPTVLWSHNAATFEDNDILFQVQSLEQCNGRPEPWLRFRCNKAVTGTLGVPVYFNNLGIWPAVGFFGAWWNNMERIVSPAVIENWGSESGDWSGEESLLSSLTPQRGVTFVDYSRTPQVFRYHRIVIETGGFHTEEPIEFSEIVLGYMQELSQTRPLGPLLGCQVEPRFPQVRFSNAAGGTSVYREVDHSVRKVTMGFMLQDEDELRAMRDRMHGAVRGGAFPSILVGTDMLGSDFCIFGRFEDNLPTNWPGGAPPGKLYVKGDLVLNEEPGPLS